MKIKSLSIKNFRGIAEWSADFEDDYNIFVGSNGSGKTSILAAIDYANKFILNQLVRTGVVHFSNSDIKNGSNAFKIEITIKFFSERYSLILIGDQKTNFIKHDNMPNNARLDLGRLSQLRDTEELSVNSTHWPFHYFFDQKRNYFQNTAGLKYSTDKKTAYSKSNSVITDFSNWFDKRDAEEGRQIRLKQDLQYKDPQLSAARTMIKKSTGFDQVYFSNETPAGIRVEKNKQTLAFDQLSSGEKTILYLVGDLARRCGILNNENPFDVSGVVLIDEIELHLHPEWHRVIIKLLNHFFPKSQFVVTTHSPQVLGEVNSKNIRIITKEGIKSFTDSTLGRDSNYLLNSVLGAKERSHYLNDSLLKIDQLINDEKYDAAKKLIAKIEKKYSSNFPEIVLQKVRLKRRMNKK